MLRTLRNHPLALIIGVGLLLRTYPWFLPHTLLGVMEVDDGVYYGAARMLLHGQLPYSDFTIVHPPVTSVLLLPFAAVGGALGDPVGMASARIAMAGVAAANIVLVHRLALRTPVQHPQRVALAGAAVYAVAPWAVIAEHTVLLEPLVNLLCLLAVHALLRFDAPSRRAGVWAGLLLTAAGGVKVFAGAYVVAVLLWLAWGGRRYLVLPVVGGLLLGALLLIVPFTAADPSAFVHDVLATQVSRPTDNSYGGLVRVLDEVVPHAVSLLALLALLVLVTLLTRVAARRAPGSPLALWVLVLGLNTVAFVNSPSYFPHYLAFLGPPLALLVGRWAAAPGRGPLTLGLVLLAFLGLAVQDDLGWHGQGDLRAAGRLVPEGACVWTEGLSLTIAADVVRLPDATCPGWIDGRGVNLTWNTDWPRGLEYYPAGFLADSRWQRETVAQLGSAEFLLLKSAVDGVEEWTPQTKAYATAHFRPVWTQHSGRVSAELWRRVS